MVLVGAHVGRSCTWPIEARVFWFDCLSCSNRSPRQRRSLVTSKETRRTSWCATELRMVRDLTALAFVWLFVSPIDVQKRNMVSRAQTFLCVCRSHLSLSSPLPSCHSARLLKYFLCSLLLRRAGINAGKCFCFGVHFCSICCVRVSVTGLHDIDEYIQAQLLLAVRNDSQANQAGGTHPSPPKKYSLPSRSFAQKLSFSPCLSSKSKVQGLLTQDQATHWTPNPFSHTQPEEGIGSRASDHDFCSCFSRAEFLVLVSSGLEHHNSCAEEGRSVRRQGEQTVVVLLCCSDIGTVEGREASLAELDPTQFRIQTQCNDMARHPK